MPNSYPCAEVVGNGARRGLPCSMPAEPGSSFCRGHRAAKAAKRRELQARTRPEIPELRGGPAESRWRRLRPLPTQRWVELFVKFHPRVAPYLMPDKGE